MVDSLKLVSHLDIDVPDPILDIGIGPVSETLLAIPYVFDLRIGRFPLRYDTGHFVSFPIACPIVTSD